MKLISFSINDNELENNFILLSLVVFYEFYLLLSYFTLSGVMGISHKVAKVTTFALTFFPVVLDQLLFNDIFLTYFLWAYGKNEF